MAATSHGDTQGEDDEREELAERVSRWLRVPLDVLAFVALVLVVLEFTTDDANALRGVILHATLPISVIFFLAFAFELTIAPSKTRYLSRNWPTAIAVVLPFLRIFRALRALRLLRGARAIRGLSVVRVVAALNRGTRALGRFFEQNRFGYVLILTVIVTLTAGAGVYYLERDHASSNINSVGDAIWFAATVVSTINSPLEPVTLEGRILAFLLRVFGLAVIGYITATIAVFLLGRPAEHEAQATREELRAIREQLAAIEASLRQPEREPEANTPGGP